MGKKYYKDFFLQYGHGLIALLNFINKFYEINFYSLGVVTSFFFSIKFIFLYLICKNLNISSIASLLFCFFIFSLLTHSQLPWPDIYSGLFLIIFFYLILLNRNRQSNILIFISSFFLFLTIYFRNTYLLNFAGCIIFYSISNIFFKKFRSNYISKILIYTSIYIILFFIIMHFDEVLKAWFVQGFGNSGNYLNLYIDGFLLKIERIIFIFSRMGWHILYPKNIYNFSFTFCFIISFIYLIKILIYKDSKFKKNDQIIIVFMIIYGFAGLIQNLNKYEILRYLNASISLYLVTIYYFFNFFKKKIFLKFLV